MPAIPTYDQTVAAPENFTRTHTPEASGADPIAAGLNQVAGGIAAVGRDAQLQQQALQKQSDERAKVWAGQQAGQTLLTEQQTLEQGMRTAPAGADGFTDSYLKGFDDRAKTALESAPDDASKRYLQIHLQAQRNHLGGMAQSFQFRAADDDVVNRFAASADTWGKAVQQVPDQYEAAMKTLSQTMPDVVPQVRQKLIDHATTTLTNAAAAGALDRNPYIVQAATSKAMGENGYVGPSGVPWVDAASPEQVKTWNNAAQVKIKQIEAVIRSTQDRQSAHSDGAVVFQSLFGSGPGGAGNLPANAGGSDVAPYAQKDIDRLTSFVKAPSPYDDLITQAAQKYNVDPAELKLRIGAESGGNPKAVSSKGATGLAQLMPATAQRYGVTDPTDPAQSINAMARIMSENGGTKGSDMSAADRAYYGGNVNAKGPNTTQYADNLRAVRQALVGSGAMPPLSTAQLEAGEQALLDKAAQVAEQRKPGDAIYRDHVITEARANWSRALQAQKGQDYGNFSTVLGETLKAGAMSPSDLSPEAQQAFSKLTPQNVQSIQAQFERNVRAANGEFTKSDPKLVNDLRGRIYLPDGDPNKITNPGQLTPYMTGINHTDFEHIRSEMAQANTPEGNPFLKQVNGVKETGRKMLTTSMNALAVSHPELAEEAAYRFGSDVDARIKAARTAGKDPQTLFTPGSPDYVLSPARVASFMPTESQVTALKATLAAQAKNPGAVPAAPAALSFASEADAAAAAQAGKLKSGDRVKIGNQTGTWH